jgi:YfiH family protein
MELVAGLADPASERALGTAAGRSGARIVRVRQVHGACVREASGRDSREGAQLTEADGLVGAAVDQLLAVSVADCVPVLLSDARGARVAAVHAGWRGLVAGVLPEAVRSLRGSAPLVAAIGPCLSLERFEVGEEVARAFEAAGLAEAVAARSGARPHVDLRLAARLQLRKSGVAEVEGTDRCTWNHRHEFFSYRRDVTHGGARTTGRMIALIGAAG